MKNLFYPILIISLFATSFGQVHAQDDETGIRQQNTQFLNMVTWAMENSTAPRINSAKRSAVGSPFLQKEWTEAKVYSIDGMVIPAKMKYDVLNDEMNIKLSKDLFVLDDKIIRQIVIGGDAFKRYPVPKSEMANDKLAYYEVLSEGKISLLKRHVTGIIRGSKGNGITEDRPDKLTLKENLYTFDQMEDAPVKFKKGKKNILALLRKKGSKVKNFVKKNKLSYKKESDLSKIFDFYNAQFEEKKDEAPAQ